MSLMAIFHPFLKIKRKKNPLYDFTVLIPTHLQTSLSLNAKATGLGAERCRRAPRPTARLSGRAPVLTATCSLGSALQGLLQRAAASHRNDS